MRPAGCAPPPPAPRLRRSGRGLADKLARGSANPLYYPKRKPGLSPRSPPAVFKVPAPIDAVGSIKGGYGACLSDSDSYTEASKGRDEAVEAAGAADAAVCPWCGERVDKAALDDFSKGARMNARQQTRFCQMHKKATALETWRRLKYPEVQWQELQGRFAQHREALLAMVEGAPSHYRSLLAHKIATGQARWMRDEASMNPGYYGPRGFNLMCDYLVSEFGEALKARAVEDGVISGRGPAAFIQTVLVAELGALLIGDDMGVDGAEARRILEESKALGEMVHDDA